MEIVFATNNAHKLSELRSIVGDKIRILSLNDIGCHDDIPEDADTLEGNAIQKARWVKDRYGYDCFADDTGLEVDALDGAPGVHSARFAPGVGHDTLANMNLLLQKMENKTDRRARFRTIIALIQGNGEPRLFEGIVNGRIIDSPRGTEGFGYDPVFVPDGYDKTFAELSAEQKNSISHRGRATRALVAFLK